VDNTLGNALVVEAVDLLASGVILQQRGTLLVVCRHRQPVISVALLNTSIGGDAPLVVVNVFGNSCKLSHLAGLLTDKALCFFRSVA